MFQWTVCGQWPLYGPVAGGTRVTITGHNLSTVAAVYFGQRQCVIDKHSRSAARLFMFTVVYKGKKTYV